MKIAIVTRCPSGIANTHFASNALVRASQKLGWQYVLETHTAEHTESLTAEQLAGVDLVVVAASGDIDLSRYAGMQVYRDSVQAPLDAPEQWLLEAQQKAVTLPEQAPVPVSSDENTATSDGQRRIVAITACPTGVAHTFMAAEALTQAAQALGHQIKVETRGSVGAKNTLTGDDIRAADVVLIAADIEIDATPFAGKRIYRTGTGTALKKAKETINNALQQGRVEGASSGTSTTPASGQADKGSKSGPYKHLMTGVSFMLPMVVAGGLLVALSFAFGIKAYEEEHSLAAALMQIGGGGGALMLMIPVLAGYIAYSIADRPGIAPGLIGGLLAFNLKTGFLGGIIAGFLAGYTAKLVVSQLKLPQSIEALKPIMIVPLIASAVTGLLMIYVVGGPVASLMETLTTFLKEMGTGNAVLLGMLLGAMMCFDLGGPINKAAYTFGTGLLASETYLPMAAIMAAGMVPAMGLGLATMINRKKFEQTEHEAGRAAFVLGLCFISEGAIPFAAKDPLRVIPCCMVGGAITGAMSMAFGCELMAPHGGLFVLAIPSAITHVAAYLAAIAVGTIVIGVSYAFLKKTPEHMPQTV